MFSSNRASTWEVFTESPSAIFNSDNTPDERKPRSISAEGTTVPAPLAVTTKSPMRTLAVCKAGASAASLEVGREKNTTVAITASTAKSVMKIVLRDNFCKKLFCIMDS
jgi:hypothetical protein